MADVFVGIPTLNRPRLVRETILSVLAQTHRDIRVVVSDNASDGGAADDVEGFIRGLGDSRVRFHRQPENVGEYGQGRFFLREATEEFFVILHDDDLLAPAYLARAVAQLRATTEHAYFVADPWFIDAAGTRLEEQTRAYLLASGRAGLGSGPFDVLSTVFPPPSPGRYLRRLRHGPSPHGFTPLCGTCFRTAALRASGFVDDDCTGNYPFEFNILLRLCDARATAWRCAEEMLAFRVHGGSMTNYIRLTDNPKVVGTMIRLLERRSYTGGSERARRTLLSRFRRAEAMIALRRGDVALCRRAMSLSRRDFPLSPRLWLMSAAALIAPEALRRRLPPLPEARTGPALQHDAATPR